MLSADLVVSVEKPYFESTVRLTALGPNVGGPFLCRFNTYGRRQNEHYCNR
jgi:hypothetical protein